MQTVNFAKLGKLEERAEQFDQQSNIRKVSSKQLQTNFNGLYIITFSYCLSSQTKRKNKENRGDAFVRDCNYLISMAKHKIMKAPL